MTGDRDWAGQDAMIDIDHIDADRFSPLDIPVLIMEAGRHRSPGAPLQAILVGTDLMGALPPVDPEDFDLLLTTAPVAPLPWVSLSGSRFQPEIAALERAIRAAPVAASVLAQTLRLTERLPVADGLIAESHAYSMLQGGAEFRRWLAGRPQSIGPTCPQGGEARERVRFERDDNHVTLTLDAPHARNAMCAGMRDALYAALGNCLDDPGRPRVSLRGMGRCFSTGGDLEEFGAATDPAVAHVIRTLHSCTRALFALGDRADVRLQGACIGSGIEIAAAAAIRTATADAWFQLPELRMGLIPGAGGTVSIQRAVGRHRACWLGLTGRRLPAPTALDWGLVHAIETGA